MFHKVTGIAVRRSLAAEQFAITGVAGALRAPRHAQALARWAPRPETEFRFGEGPAKRLKTGFAPDAWNAVGHAPRL